MTSFVRLPRHLLALALGLALITAVPFAGGQDAEPPKPPSFAEVVDRYLDQLDGAAIITGNHGRLGLQLCIYEDAWKTHALRELQAGLRKDVAVEEIVKNLQSQEKQRKSFRSKSCFRLVLSHADGENESGEDVQTVHYFLKSLPHCIRLQLGKGSIPWQVLEQPTELTQQRVRVARHYTARRGRRVPFVSPLKPERARVVFQTSEVSIWGVFSNALLRKKKGTVNCTAAYEEYRGKYDGQHIVDLNDASHVFEQEQELVATRKLPFLFPLPPPAIEEFLERVAKKG
ncbi:MAG: hypothetical protein AAF581_04190 [Planctomycetota bacterium]